MKVVFSVLLALIPALAFGYLRQPTEMGLAIIAGGLAAVFVNIDKIQRVKGAGFEAEMRKAVEETYATREALRQLGKPLLELILHILTMAGRVGGMNPHQKHVFRTELERLGQDLGVAGDQAVRSAHELFFRYHTWDHFDNFASHVHEVQVIPEGTCEKLMIMRKYESSDYPSRDDIEAALGNDADKLRAADKERLEDYIHYREQRNLRRPEALSGE